MADAKNYTGGCHCGQVRFDVTTDLSIVTQCNCSICQKRGALWTFVTSENFALRAGDDDLRDYQFGKRTIHHYSVRNAGWGRSRAGWRRAAPRWWRSMSAASTTSTSPRSRSRCSTGAACRSGIGPRERRRVQEGRDGQNPRQTADETRTKPSGRRSTRSS